jgi:hypothetical protein
MNDDTQIYVDIGKILAAREAVLYIKKKYKENYAGAEGQLQQARNDLNHFGLYDDCGPSYEADYDKAKKHVAESEKMLPVVISFEKHYKKLKHEFKEKYPAPEQQQLLHDYLTQQTQDIDKEYRKKLKP